VRFDPATGRCSSSLTLPGGGKCPAFSPDSKVLYISGQFYRDPNQLAIRQYDLQAGSSTAILASGQWLGPVRVSGAPGMGQMQLDPKADCTLATRTSTRWLAWSAPTALAQPAISAPTAFGRPPKLVPGPGGVGFVFVPRTSFRLRTFISSYLYPADFVAADACQGDSVRPRNPQRLNLVRWRFNAPARRPTVAYRYAQPGTYRVSVRVYYDDFSSDTLSQFVTVGVRPTIALPRRYQCMRRHAHAAPPPGERQRDKLPLEHRCYHAHAGRHPARRLPPHPSLGPGAGEQPATRGGSPAARLGSVRQQPRGAASAPPRPRCVAYRWQEGSTQPTLLATQPGTCTLTVRYQCHWLLGHGPHGAGPSPYPIRLAWPRHYGLPGRHGTPAGTGYECQRTHNGSALAQWKFGPDLSGAGARHYALLR
jgi:hypothetical protein